MFFKPEYILILAGTIIVDYAAGILIEGSNNPRKRKMFLILSLVANIGVLAVFKYYNFFNENITGLCSLLGYNNPIPYLNMLLPIGLSFHTFQAMSYTIEVYRGNQRAERHFGIYALYVMFYPQLVAGPIERPQNMLHQFHEVKQLIPENVYSGLRLMLWGMFKKVVIADRLAQVPDALYANPAIQSVDTVWVGIFFFAFQMYCDFSGYSDIALGSARVMGFQLMKNFNFPYTSRSITEYWRRWHISLSTWFNDYLFNPIVINNRQYGKFAVVLGLFVTFLVSGLWHGAGWTYIIWGLLYAIATSYEFLTTKFRKKMSKKIPSFIYDPASQALTFSFILFAFIFFRAHSVVDAVYVIKKASGIFTFISSAAKGQLTSNLLQVISRFELLLSFALILFLLIAEWMQNKHQLTTLFSRQSVYARWAVYYALIFMIVFFGFFEKHQFIYFQF
jgi:D-alanyl-lipoteichoic acid acyltransferase DltB (MBOAT superfamily)